MRDTTKLLPGGYYDTDEMRPHMTFGWAVPIRESELREPTA